MDQFLPDLHLIWRPVEFASVGGIDALYKEYRRLIKTGGHAWWTQRLSLTYVRLLDQVIEDKGPVYLYPVEDPREAGNQVFKLRARIDGVLYNHDGSFVPQPDDNLPYRREGGDRIYSACWVRLVSMEVIPFEELPEPTDYVVLPYGDDVVEALGGKFSKGFILPTDQYAQFKKTSLAQRLETLERVAENVAAEKPMVTKLHDFEKRIAETVARDAAAGESVFDVAGEPGLSVHLREERAERITSGTTSGEHELRLDTDDDSLIIGAPGLELDRDEERRSYGEVSLDLSQGGRVVSERNVDTFKLDRELTDIEEDGGLSREDRQLIELGIDWDVLHRMRRKLARYDDSGLERPSGESAVIDSTRRTVAEFDSSEDEEAAVVEDTKPTTPTEDLPPVEPVPEFGGEAVGEDLEEEEPSKASLPTPEDIARALSERGPRRESRPEAEENAPATIEPLETPEPGVSSEPIKQTPPEEPFEHISILANLRNSSERSEPVRRPEPAEEASVEKSPLESKPGEKDERIGALASLREEPVKEEPKPVADKPPTERVEALGRLRESPAPDAQPSKTAETTDDFNRAVEEEVARRLEALGRVREETPPEDKPAEIAETKAEADAGTDSEEAVPAALREVREPTEESADAAPAAEEPFRPLEELLGDEDEDAQSPPEPALTSRELEEPLDDDDEAFSFPDLPPLKEEGKPRSIPTGSAMPPGLNLFADEEPTDTPRPLTESGETESLLIPTVDSLLRNAEARDSREKATPEPADVPLALPREVASGIRKIREHLVIDSEQVAHIITNLLLGKHVIIGGPTGCGKTTLARLIPSLIWNIYPEIVQAMSSWGAGDLLGQVYPLPDGGSAVSGILTRTILKNYQSQSRGYSRAPFRAPNGAQYEGVWLVLDELDNSDWTALISDFLAASDADSLRIPVVSSPGEHVKIPLPRDFRLLATFNDPDGPRRLEKLSQSTRRRLAFVELHSPSDEAAERKAVRRNVQSTVYEQLGLATRASDLGGQIENTLFRFVRLTRSYRDIGTAPLVTILADVQVETQMGLEAWKTLDEAISTNIIPLLGGLESGVLRIIGNLAANTPERIHAYLASNLPKRYADEGFRQQLQSYLEFLLRTSRYRRDDLHEDIEELVELVSTGIPQGEVQTLVRALELREGNLGSTLLPAVKLGSTLFETIRGLTRLINVAQGRR